VLIDGRPLAAYVHAYESGGRVYATVAPLLTQLADRLWLSGGTLVVQRGKRRVHVVLEPPYASDYGDTFVPAGPVLRALGASVRYDAPAHRLMVTIPLRAPLLAPTPFVPPGEAVVPSSVFTPIPGQTPRPIWTGSPMPRRTALPFPPPARAMKP